MTNAKLKVAGLLKSLRMSNDSDLKLIRINKATDKVMQNQRMLTLLKNNYRNQIDTITENLMVSIKIPFAFSYKNNYKINFSSVF